MENRQWVAYMDVICAAFATRNQALHDFAVPSFSLGLTQEESNPPSFFERLKAAATGSTSSNMDDMKMDIEMSEGYDDLEQQEDNHVTKMKEVENKENTSKEVKEKDELSKEENNIIQAGTLEKTSSEDILRTQRQCLAKEERCEPSKRIKGKDRKCTSKQPEFRQSHAMVIQGDTEKKKAPALRSPFVVTEMKKLEKLDKLEMNIYYWIMHNDGADKDEVVFANGITSLTRKRMMSMAPCSLLNREVIDAWTDILNHAESTISKSELYRFFASTHPCMYTIVDPSDRIPLEQRKKSFMERLNDAVQAASGCAISKIGLFLFPIFDAGHYYVISFNVKKFQIDIIDNSQAMEDQPIESKYGDILQKLSEIFADYLLSHKLKAKSNGIKKASIHRLKMPWREPKNDNDSGIYAMRHMETYLGDGMRGWDTGFKKNNKKQMRYLRVEYLKSILTAEVNIHQHRNIDKVESFNDGAKAVDAVDIDNLLTTTNPEDNIPDSP